jgi:hypothetical protein
MPKLRTVLMTGMFDMKNFGDLMFPLIAQHRLQARGFTVLPVSPTGRDTGFPDALPSISLKDMLRGEREDVCGILIGGGYMIHTHKMHFLEEYDVDGLADFAGAGLWLGAALSAVTRNVPMLWNAPGVPHPFAGSQRALIDAALAAADYVSLRDRGSIELLKAPPALSPAIVPDPVADIARLWRPDALQQVFRALVQRKGGRTNTGYLSLHFRFRSVEKIGVAALAERVDAFSQAHGLQPLLVAVGQTHADDVLAREIAGHLKTPHIVLDDPQSLMEIAAAVGGSRLYMGSSLHGYVTAAAYGVPGVLVAQPSYRKFQGFLDHTGRSRDLARDWGEAFDIGARLANEGIAQRVPDSVATALDAHWDRILAALETTALKHKERGAFLQAWLRAGMETGGDGWPHLPYTRRSGSGLQKLRLTERAG